MPKAELISPDVLVWGRSTWVEWGCSVANSGTSMTKPSILIQMELPHYEMTMPKTRIPHIASMMLKVGPLECVNDIEGWAIGMCPECTA